VERTPPSRPKPRLFVALELPEATRGRAAGLLPPHEGLRPAAERSLHVTLAFLGWQREEDVERIAQLTGAAVAGHAPVRLVPTDVRAVPPRRSRLFALDLEDPEGACGRLQASVVAALAGAGFLEPEERPFWPHVTLARVRKGQRVRELSSGRPPGPFTADNVVLYRSTLRPDGAVYEPQRGFTLEA
jgi:RNA 2',3'-cyclic 3'-phosphodiesterase